MISIKLTTLLAEADLFSTKREESDGSFMVKWSETQKKWGIYILFLSILFLFFRYILPLFAPFVLAFLIVAPLEPFLERLSGRLHISKSILAGSVMTFLLGILMTVGILAGSCVFRLLGRFPDHAHEFEQRLGGLVGKIGRLLEEEFSVRPDLVEIWVNDLIRQTLNGLKAHLFPKVMNQSVVYCCNLAKALLFFLILWIASVLLAKDFNHIREHFRYNAYVRYAKNELKKLGGFVRTFLVAQMIIMGGISVISMMGLLLGGFPLGQAVAVGLFTGLLDALPFLGTGVILLPIALWHLIEEDLLGFVVLIVVFVVSVIFRELMEPRLIGSKMGFWPVLMLMAVYVGAQIFGFLGVILGPIYFIIAADWYRNAEIGELHQ
ncbi:MAG: AI-2E family transporter [Lachnospiraceae bacterium]|nr:AI-2E family transporter [Lachnospiraceae bacterium]